VSGVISAGKTGGEIKALTLLPVLSEQVKDICKAVDKDIQINNIRLLYKTGETGCINSGIV